MSQAPPGWPPPGLAERLADLEATRHAMSPLSPVELAVVADLLALGIVQLGRDAIRRQLHPPVEAMAGAQALHEWARDLLAQEATDGGRARRPTAPPGSPTRSQASGEAPGANTNTPPSGEGVRRLGSWPG